MSEALLAELRTREAEAIRIAGPPPAPPADITQLSTRGRIDAWANHRFEVLEWHVAAGTVTDEESAAIGEEINEERSARVRAYRRVVELNERAQALTEEGAVWLGAFTQPGASGWTCPQPRGWVYFVQVGDTGPVKIGVTGDVARRMAELQTGCAWQLRLLAVAPAAPHTEAEMHAKFAPARFRGEWFVPAPEIVRFAAELRQRWMPLFETGVYPPWDEAQVLPAQGQAA